MAILLHQFQWKASARMAERWRETVLSAKEERVLCDGSGEDRQEPLLLQQKGRNENRLEKEKRQGLLFPQKDRCGGDGPEKDRFVSVPVFCKGRHAVRMEDLGRGYRQHQTGFHQRQPVRERQTAEDPDRAAGGGWIVELCIQ